MCVLPLLAEAFSCTDTRLRPQAKNAFDSLNGFHLMDRYLVGASASPS